MKMTADWKFGFVAMAILIVVFSVIGFCCVRVHGREAQREEVRR